MSGSAWDEYKGEWRDEGRSKSEFDVGGNEYHDEAGGKRYGIVGNEKGIEESSWGNSEDSGESENVGELGEDCGVRRRTYVEIGVFAIRSVTDTDGFSFSRFMVALRDKVRGEDGGRGEVEYG
jgi:hypothetical protein